ncbi:MAG TPA: NAD(P)/FAD-dependent oxidoreductase [Humisphaera sp.]
MTPPEVGSPHTIPHPVRDAVDVAIVGAGPAGLFAAFYAGMRGLSVLLVDSQPQLGGQLAALYPEQILYDVPGFAGQTAREVTHRLADQAELARPVVQLNRTLQRIVRAQDEFTLHASGTQYRSRVVILAAGVGALTPKPLPVAAAARYDDLCLHYHLSDNLNQFLGRQVIVAGNSLQAVDWAIRLSKVAAGVTLVHRHENLRVDPHHLEALRLRGVATRAFCEVAELRGDKHIEQAILRDTRDGRCVEMRATDVLAAYGYDSSLAFLNDLDLKLSPTGVCVDTFMRTSRDGIYAVGDVCSYPGKLKLIATGFGEAATAVNHAMTWLNPQANYFPGHSTSVARRRLAGLQASDTATPQLP